MVTGKSSNTIQDGLIVNDCGRDTRWYDRWCCGGFGVMMVMMVMVMVMMMACWCS